MKKILALQGSPRKKGNTATLLNEVINGAKEAGAQTEMIHLASLSMTGCRGCYTCKKEGDTYGKCILKDDMKNIYEKIDEADGVIFGSPVYMCAMTPELKMVLDRLFPYLTKSLGTIMPPGKKSALVFTQNQKDPALFEWHFNMTAFMLNTIGFEKPEMLVSVNTIGYNVNEMDKIKSSDMEKVHAMKLKHKEEFFKKDLESAFDIGRKMAG